MGRYTRKRTHRFSEPVFICDRSGFKFPISELVVEPGTNFVVHYTESDGQYSMVKHPQNRPYKQRPQRKHKWAKYVRPDIPDDSGFVLLTEDAFDIITEDGNVLVYTDISLTYGHG